MALNESRPDIKPNMIACLIDISEHCEEDFVERCGGKVYFSGFYDDNVNTYICSAEKMIYVDVIAIVPEKYPKNERAADALSTDLYKAMTGDDSGYYSRSDIERMRKEHPDHFRELNLSFDEGDDPMEETREFLEGNPEF